MPVKAVLVVLVLVRLVSSCPPTIIGDLALWVYNPRSIVFQHTGLGKPFCNSLKTFPRARAANIL
jgi:hypothetical protein